MDDTRLDPYRDRAGTLSRGGAPVGTIYLAVERWWSQVGGHLWWRKWSPSREVVHWYVEFEDGRFEDGLTDPEIWEAELGEWSQGRMPYRGALLDVRWLDDSDSERLWKEFWQPEDTGRHDRTP